MDHVGNHYLLSRYYSGVIKLSILKKEIHLKKIKQNFRNSNRNSKFRISKGQGKLKGYHRTVKKKEYSRAQKVINIFRESKLLSKNNNSKQSSQSVFAKLWMGVQYQVYAKLIAQTYQKMFVSIFWDFAKHTKYQIGKCKQ